MELNRRNYPFEIRGKLRTRPDEALRMFGFCQSEDALGVIIRKGSNGKYQIYNWISQKLTLHRIKMGSKMKELSLEWGRLPCGVKRMYNVKVTACNMFQKYNLKGLVRTLSDRRELLSRGNMPDMSRIYITESWLFELP